MNTNRIVAFGLLALCLMTVVAPAASATAAADTAVDSKFIVLRCIVTSGGGQVNGQSIDVGPVHVDTDTVYYTYCV